MSELKAMEARIEDKLQELMEARGWELSDSEHYIIYRKDGITIDMEVDSVGYWRAPTGYQIIFYRSRQYNRRFKVDIVPGRLTEGTFTIDEKKLDKKIEEVCAILRERDEAYRKREKQTEEREKEAVEFAAAIGKLFPLYKATPYKNNCAELELPGGDVFITGTAGGDYYVKVNFSLISNAAELPTLIRTLAEFS